MVLITGGIDLSIGSVLGLSALVAGKLLNTGVGIPTAILCAVVTGTAVGLLNGVLVAVIRVPPLIATMGTMIIARGVTTVVTQGFLVGGFPKSFEVIGQGYLWGIPLPVCFVVVVAIAAGYLLKNARFLQQLYFIGGNTEAARLSGIRVERVTVAVYAISATLSAIAGVIMAARLGVVATSFGVGAELRAIPAAVIGGASLSGGEGTIGGTMLGVIFLALLTNAFVLLNVSVYWQGVASGVILLAAVIFDRLRYMKRQ